MHKQFMREKSPKLVYSIKELRDDSFGVELMILLQTLIALTSNYKSIFRHRKGLYFQLF